jgi:hypothetical protein
MSPEKAGDTEAVIPTTPQRPGGPLLDKTYQAARAKWHKWHGNHPAVRNVINNDITRLPNQRPG